MDARLSERMYYCNGWTLTSAKALSLTLSKYSLGSLRKPYKEMLGEMTGIEIRILGVMHIYIDDINLLLL